MDNYFEPQRRIKELEDNFLVQDWMDSVPLTAEADNSVQELAELMAASRKENVVIVSSDNSFRYTVAISIKIYSVSV